MSLFCSFHKCKRYDCKQERTNESGYCDLDNCKDAWCPNKKDDSSVYCRRHKCSSCIDYASIKYCDNHKCGISECLNMRSRSSSYCSIHKCLSSSCNDNSEYVNSYCYLHKCETSGCFNSKAQNNSYCSKHKNAPDDYLDSDLCVLCKKTRDRSNLCSIHVCGGGSDCNSAAVEGLGNNPLCDDHRCKYDNCRKEREDRSYFCYDHRCNFEDCTILKTSDSYYCYDHKCWKMNCKSSKDGPNYYYCSTHKCISENCQNMAIGEKYCEDHGCFICYEEIQSHIYCSEHTPDELRITSNRNKS